MNDSAVASHAVKLTVQVYSQIPVSSLNEHKYKNCNSARTSQEKDALTTSSVYDACGAGGRPESAGGAAARQAPSTEW
jgi:hypothetical protein